MPLIFRYAAYFSPILSYSKLNVSSQFYRSETKRKRLETFFRARSRKSFSPDDDILSFHEFGVRIAVIAILGVDT